MVCLIDTHVCLWAFADRKKLPSSVLKLLEDERNTILVSQFSLLEIAVKLSIGKLPEFETSMSEFIDEIRLADFEILPVKNEHTIAYAAFEVSPEYRDPFDRYLVSTAHYEDIPFITKDAKFQLYKDRV